MKNQEFSIAHEFFYGLKVNDFGEVTDSPQLYNRFI